MGLFEWFALQSEAALLQTPGQAVFCIIESMWLHGDQGVEKIKPYGLYTIHEPYIIQIMQ
jgi:hypothetical protein